MPDLVEMPTLTELGVTPANPFEVGEVKDEALFEEILAVRAPHKAAELADRTWANKLLEGIEAPIDREGEDYQKYKEYLEAAKARGDHLKGDSPDELSLDDYEMMCLREYHGMLDPNYPVTNGFVALFALGSARVHRKASSQVGALVIFKHQTRANVEILEGVLSDEDREVYAPLKDIQDTPPYATEKQAVMSDPEAVELLDRYKVLEATYNKRGAVKGLLDALGIEIGEEGLSRQGIKALATVISWHGDTILA
jgi:hypothetical protein